MIKVGIVGYGFAGSYTYMEMGHFPKDIRVTAVCDINSAALEKVPEGVERYSDLDSMLWKADIDTVVVSCNNNQHFRVVTAAARAGKHIWCEKPAAMSVEEYDRMLQVVEENGVSFTVHQQRRYDRDFSSVREVLKKKLVGDVYTVQSSLYGYNGNMHDWHVYKAEGGGMMYDWGVHLLDQILYLIPGKVKTVYAQMRNVINTEVDDFFKIQLLFESGISAEVELGTYFLSDKSNWFTRHWFVGGNRGSMYADGFDPVGKIVTTKHLLENVKDKTLGDEGPTRSFGTPEEGLITVSDIPHIDTTYYDYIQNYIDTRNGKCHFLVRKDEVRRVLLLMEAVRKSSELGRSVDFE